MTHHENLKILAFVGGDETQKDTLVAHLTGRGYPKVSRDDMVLQIEHLVEAGQHRIITDELIDFELYESMRHEFPGELNLIGITSHSQAEAYLERQEKSREDWNKLEHTHHTELLPLAHHYIFNDNGADILSQIDELIQKLDFTL